MKPIQAFFLADGLLALGVILLGTAAVHSLSKASIQARFDHQIRQRAWSILSHAEAWAPEDAGTTWQRGFDFQGEPVGDGEVFLLEAEHEAAENIAQVRYEISFHDGRGIVFRLWREHPYWQVQNEGL